jgi:hypothetical protein
MKHPKAALVAALVVAALASSGCTLVWIGGGAAVGAGTVAYLRGDLKVTEEASLDKVWAATGKAMQDLEFKTINQKKDAVSARLLARTAADKKIEINLKKVTEKLTELRIRVDTFGDESLSRLILNKIEKNLQ